MDALASVERSRAQIWVDHAWRPFVLFIGIAWLLGTTRLDLTIARALFFDASGPGWVGSHSWFVNELVHTGGRWVVRVVASLALVLWALSFRIDGLLLLLLLLQDMPAAAFV